MAKQPRAKMSLSTHVFKGLPQEKRVNFVYKLNNKFCCPFEKNMELRVTVEMIEHVRAVLDSHRRCFVFLFWGSGGGSAAATPKDIQKLVWHKAAGELERM